MAGNIIAMKRKYLDPTLDLVEEVFTDHENAEEGKLVRMLVQEIRSMDTYIPELELVMVDEAGMPLGYCMFSRFQLEGRYERECCCCLRSR